MLYVPDNSYLAAVDIPGAGRPGYETIQKVCLFLLFTVSVSVALSVPAVVVAWQVYRPPWDVRTGVNFIVLVRVKVGVAVVIT